MSMMGEVFGTGIKLTSASFHWLGTLKMDVTGTASSREKDFRSEFGSVIPH